MARRQADQQPAVVSDRVPMAAPLPRLERVTEWMRDHALDALVATGTDVVTWLTGYARYYGGPSALVVDPAGERTLVVLRDEVQVAERLADADRVTGYGERGFGLELNPLPLLAAEVRTLPAVASAARIGVAGEDAGHIAAETGAEAVAAGDALHHMSLIKDGDELTKIFHAYELCWLAHAAVAEGAQGGASEIEMMSAAQAAAQVAHGEPVEFGADLLAAGNTAQVCGPIAVAGRTRAAAGAPVIADICVRADGYWADTCRVAAARSRTSAGSSGASSPRRRATFARERPAPASSRQCGRGSRRPGRTGSFPTTAAMAWGSASSMTRTSSRRIRVSWRTGWCWRWSPASTCRAGSASATRTCSW
jgi:Xaa-Pro aminopeptidase